MEQIICGLAFFMVIAVQFCAVIAVRRLWYQSEHAEHCRQLPLTQDCATQAAELAAPGWRNT
jgi:hypothetical protein